MESGILIMVVRLLPPYAIATPITTNDACPSASGVVAWRIQELRFLIAKF
ncbi:MAG: hypothetical protein P8P83_04135 [Rickettsiaceae bacterium]|nr:hypothetical protein [Rickettsiaceae bacterium]